MGYGISGLDSGFSPRRSRRTRAGRRGERNNSPPCETAMQRHDRRRSKSSSDVDGDFEVRIKFDANIMNHEDGDDGSESLGSLDETVNEDHDNPDDLDDMPEALGAVVYSGQPTSSVTLETNGVRQSQEVESALGRTESDMCPLSSQRVGRQGRRSRSEAASNRPKTAVTDSAT
ncbi:hypothetical protein FBUS_07574 [Fasciolopsis buskii]|uniref:Uncharacterized protein n=1 Tax=Fasciolopsis buskii TaxID=27845 RepID=A0A8E0VPE1_9TREM|nr:hypothetical protein FBUS_07574 [Fasciolopsis buski]